MLDRKFAPQLDSALDQGRDAASAGLDRLRGVRQGISALGVRPNNMDALTPPPPPPIATGFRERLQRSAQWLGAPDGGMASNSEPLESGLLGPGPAWAHLESGPPGAGAEGAPLEPGLLGTGPDAAPLESGLLGTEESEDLESGQQQASRGSGASGAAPQEAALADPQQEGEGGAEDWPEPRIGTITASRLRIRSSPTTATRGNIVGRFRRGHRVETWGCRGDWLVVDHNEEQAYIHGGYVELAEVEESEEAETADANASETSASQSTQPTETTETSGEEQTRTPAPQPAPTPAPTRTQEAPEVSAAPSSQSETPDVQQRPAVETSTREPSASAPMPKRFSEKAAAKAVRWGESQNYASEILEQLQEKLGAPVTGVYDRDLAIAVHLAGTKSGKATKRFFHRQGILPYQQTETVDADLDAIKRAHPDGVAVACYADYDRNSHAYAAGEFIKQSGAFAKGARAVGVKGGAVTQGIANPVGETGQIVEVIRTIHDSLVAKYRASAPSDRQAEVPNYCKIKELSFFCHGMHYGLGINKNSNYREGVHAYDLGKNKSNVESFVHSIAGALTRDITVQLYACNTGMDINMINKMGTKKTNNKEWNWHEEGGRRGENSFGDLLNKQLEKEGKESSVYTHATAGHMARNYAARVFGKDAQTKEGEQQAGGAQIFDILYPSDYIQSETERLFPGVSEDKAEKCRTSVREEMWRHFKLACLDAKKHKKARRFSEPIGMMMFIDQEKAAQVLRGDWITWFPKSPNFKKMQRAYGSSASPRSRR